MKEQIDQIVAEKKSPQESPPPLENLAIAVTKFW